MFTLRLDAPNNANEDKLLYHHHVKILLDYLHAEKYVIFWEKSEKVQKYHWQGWYLSEGKMTATSHAKYIQKQFLSLGLMPQGSWLGTKRSIGEVKDPSKYQKYISKDGSITHSHGYTDKELESFLETGKHAKLEYEFKKSKTIKTVLAESTAELFGEDIWPYSTFYRKLTETILDEYANMNISFDEFLFKRHIHFLINRHKYHPMRNRLLQKYTHLVEDVIINF